MYCGVCGLHPELCSYGGPVKYAQCLPWLTKHAPEFALSNLSLNGSGGPSDESGRGDGTGGSSGVVAAGGGEVGAAGSAASVGASGGGAKAEAAAAAKTVFVTVKDEGKRTITTIRGLEPYCAKLKDAGSMLAKKVGAGSSVKPSVANPSIQEIIVQVREPPWKCSFPPFTARPSATLLTPLPV